MSFDDNKSFWKEFMALYQEKPCLWDIKNKEYRNKSLRNAAYNSLVKKSKELFPDANKDFVIRKISSFRSSFRRQVRRIENSKRNAPGDDDNVPDVTLWYFDLLLFLLDPEERSSVMSALKGQNFSKQLQETETETLPSETNQNATSRKRYKKVLRSPKVLQNDVALEMTEKQETTFGRNVGQQLEELDPKQKIIAQKLISDILFHAKFGILNNFSTVFVGSQPSTNSTVTVTSISVQQSS